MAMTSYDIYRYSDFVVLVFGILGNILVVISILRQKAQKTVVENRYYFLVLQLAICDLGVLIIYLVDRIASYWYESLFTHSVMSCGLTSIYYVFQVAGICMMLVISLLRYRATVHPLKPAISRRKLKVVCGLVYIFGCISGYGAFLPECFTQALYVKFSYVYTIVVFYIAPTILLAVVYYKIGRAIIKQNKHMKSVRSTPVSRSTPASSSSVLRYIRNRRTFLVCLVTVICYGIANIPMSVNLILYIAEERHLLMKYVWITYFANVLRVAGSHSVNPVIYGILDKKLLTFWKLCLMRKRRPEENIVVANRTIQTTFIEC
jgi:hypothetical protein